MHFFTLRLDVRGTSRNAARYFNTTNQHYCKYCLNIASSAH